MYAWLTVSELDDSGRERRRHAAWKVEVTPIGTVRVWLEHEEAEGHEPAGEITLLRGTGVRVQTNF